MSENNTSLFRKKSIDTIESPEQLNSYLKVTSPGTWIFLLAVAAILCGAIIWGIFGRINTEVKVAVVNNSERTYCVVPFDKVKNILESGSVTVDEIPYAFTGEIINPDSVSEETDVRIRIAGGFDIGTLTVELPIAGYNKEDVSEGTVVTESLRPIMLLFQ